MPGNALLAFDLGAESGRAILGCLDSGKLELQELHRFSNQPAIVNGHLYWDVHYLWNEILHGLRCARAKCGDSLSSIGLDTWGVDFGLLDSKDFLIGNPFHYRDSRTDGMISACFEICTPEEVYEQTGNQFMQYNSLYQLLAMRLAGDPALSSARTFLKIADLFNFWLTGRKASEFTIATTSQCFNPRTANWAYDLINKMGLPEMIFGEIIYPGSQYGELRPDIGGEVGLGPIPVAVIGSHDTASAVAAIPFEGDRSAFISSGTWSLVGSLLEQPVINSQSLAFNFTNEGGVGGKYRFLKNISALWLVQECRRTWAADGRNYSYDELTSLAEQATAFRSLVDPSDPCFLSPGDMPRRIQRYCLATDQVIPETVGEFVRCALESLALSYRQVLDQLKTVLGYQLERIHIVGGGSRNQLLNQFTADACRLPVYAGPVEATAIGNILAQALSLGQLGSIQEARDLVLASFPLQVFQPRSDQIWDFAIDRFQKLKLLSEV